MLGAPLIGQELMDAPEEVDALGVKKGEAL
jgi:hypothetical protein